MKRLILTTLSFIVLMTALFPVTALADSQTTIIMMDNEKSTYQIGETLTFYIGVSSPDGGYITSAYCGFGYNQSTMELISETDTPDHIWIKSSTPSRWLYSKEIQFRVKADGKIYFIAGAYEGNGKIQAYKADGSRIGCPRASVVYKAGTGIYTPTSDCNAKSIIIKDANTGIPIEWNRGFDKYSTEYYATDVSQSLCKVSIEATAENENDTVVYPEDNEILPGENEIHVGIKSTDGQTKDYVFHITKPEEAISVTDIRIRGNDGEYIAYGFDSKVFEYDLTVGNGIDSVSFEAVTGGSSKAEYPKDLGLETGYNNKTVTIYTDTDEKVYEYYIFRELSDLSLSSLVVEASDEYVYPFDKDFSSDITEYTMSIPSDVQSVAVTYTLGNEADSVKEDFSEPVELTEGDNAITITVTDGVNEKPYTVHVVKDEAPTFVETEAETKPPKEKEWTEYEKPDLSKILLVAGIVVIIIVLVVVAITIKTKKEFDNSDEGTAKREADERKKRLKQMDRELKKKLEETNKKQ